MTFLTGRLSPAIGGPYQTLRGYAHALRDHGARVFVLAIDDGDLGVLADELDVETIPRRRPPLAIASLVARLLPRPHRLVVLGVWHPAFFAAAAVSWVTGRRFTLLPTMSLMPIDWHKHAWAKRCLKPFIGLTLRARCDVIFASAGERSSSQPSYALARATVLPHPHLGLPGASITASADSRRLVFVGRVARQKDLSLLLRAVALLPPPWSLLVCGGVSEAETSLGEELMRLSEEVGLRGRVDFTGWVPRDDIASRIAGCFASVYTSVDENYCHGAVECMSTGLPAVMVDRIASANAFEAAGAALSCSASPQALAREVEALASDGERWTRLSCGAGRYAEERERSGAKDAYRAVLQGPE